MISAIIPVCNEPPEYVEQTVSHLVGHVEEIVVVDDCSETPVVCRQAHVIRNTKRVGSAASRAIGIAASKMPIIVTTDAHVKFLTPGWASKVKGILLERDDIVLCFACVPTGESNFKGRLYGGSLAIAAKPWGLSGVLTPRWNTSCPESGLVQCVMGGAYAFCSSWYRKINGYGGIKGWCQTELASLSLRTALAGGVCKIDSSIEVEHVFRKTAPFVVDQTVMASNRMRLAMATLPIGLASTIPSLLAGVPNINLAMRAYAAGLTDVLDDREKMETLARGDFEGRLLAAGIDARVTT